MSCCAWWKGSSMNQETSQEFDFEIGGKWPQQIVVDHEPYWRAWRRQAAQCKAISEKVYATIGRNWCEFANGKNIGPRLMIEWVMYLRTRKSLHSETGFIQNSHAIRYASAVGTYLRWLWVVGAIEKDPGECMPRIRRQPPTPKKIYTHDEYLQMTKFAEDRPEWATHHWLVVLGYHTGLSLIDCCMLTWEQALLPDDGPCYIRRIREKLITRFGTKAMCTIPIIVGSELWVWFQRLHRRREPGRPGRDDIEYVHPEAAEFAFVRPEHPTEQMKAFLRAALGFKRKGRTFRHLRNTFASRLINSGSDSILVAKMTGHTNINQLAGYVIPDQSAMQNAVLKALRFVDGQTKLPAKRHLLCS